MRLNRWAKSGVLEGVCLALQAEGLAGMETLSLDATSIKVHPDAHGALQKGRVSDVMFTAFIHLAIICISLHSVNTP